MNIFRSVIFSILAIGSFGGGLYFIFSAISCIDGCGGAVATDPSEWIALLGLPIAFLLMGFSSKRYASYFYLLSAIIVLVWIYAVAGLLS